MDRQGRILPAMSLITCCYMPVSIVYCVGVGLGISVCKTNQKSLSRKASARCLKSKHSSLLISCLQLASTLIQSVAQIFVS